MVTVKSHKRQRILLKKKPHNTCISHTKKQNTLNQVLFFLNRKVNKVYQPRPFQ